MRSRPGVEIQRKERHGTPPKQHELLFYGSIQTSNDDWPPKEALVPSDRIAAETL